MRISIVSYLNSYPFHYGLISRLDPELHQVEPHTPAQCAEKLGTGKVDVGLIPVGALEDRHEIVSEFGIASWRHVRSVLLLSHSPLNEVNTIMTDHESRSSNLLTKVLFEEHWRRRVEFVKENPENPDKTAYVCIGDKALKNAAKYEFRYDLAEAWHDMTGLPFVFAVWAADETHFDFDSLPGSGFEEALAYGTGHLAESVAWFGTACLETDDAVNYLKNNIKYHLDEKCFDAISLFRSLAKKITV